MSVEKVKGGYENIGKTGKRHGVFKSKAAAEAQKAAMFANGFHVKGDRIHSDHHKAFKQHLHEMMSKAYDEHMKSLGLMEDHEDKTDVDHQRE